MRLFNDEGCQCLLQAPISENRVQHRPQVQVGVPASGRPVAMLLGMLETGGLAAQLV